METAIDPNATATEAERCKHKKVKVVWEYQAGATGGKQFTCWCEDCLKEFHVGWSQHGDEDELEAFEVD